jgi:phenylpropionate dioxygenase-like ring-hydroxylating dioxygenase large terminal subunit
MPERQHNHFPLNAWYVAARDVEVGRALLARVICNQKVVLYRQGDGSVAALEDACWHRLLPLSMGKLDGDDVVCGYHGLQFNSQGQCTHMPTQQTINPSACVRAYPVLLRHRYIWIWPGDPTRADPGLIPDIHWNDDPAWAGDGRVIHAKCDYRLVLDNLMDLSHEAFVHGSSLGHKEVGAAPTVATHGARVATVTRWMENIEPPPFWGSQMKAVHGHAGRTDRWQVIRFEAPNSIVLDVGVAMPGSGALTADGRPGERSQGVTLRVCHTVTPETDATCHYYWSTMRNYRLDDQALTTRLTEGTAAIFREDEHVLQAQQVAMTANPDKEFYNIDIDAGSVWMRRLIDDMVARERPSAPVIPIRQAG